MTTPAEKSPFKHRSAEAEMLIKRMKTMSIGDTITYDEITQITGIEIKNGKRGLIYTALRSLVRDHDMVFECVVGVGYKRCDAVQTIENTSHDMQRISRTARRSKGKLACFDPSSLDQGKRAEYYARIAQCNLLGVVVKPKRYEVLQLAAQKEHGALKIGTAVSAMFDAEK